MRDILLGSAAIPGFFPPVRIPVNVNGRQYIERHVDGGVSQALFFHPPPVPPHEIHDPSAKSLYGVDVYVLVAGKLYADPEEVKPRSLSMIGKSVSALTYAQTRGDLFRLWTASQLAGMNFHMSAIAPDYPAPSSSTEFNPRTMTAMFDNGVQRSLQGTAWRTTPPGVEPGESTLSRDGTSLINQPPPRTN